ncbi:hypothetical protein R1sor_025668 [Riccia sorocarpa]|uniref:Uncharacterized protein n=1 Tax=Riccia sorocarpa TaxID=122646 RepID=A0ABD3G9B9_9MARC
MLVICLRVEPRTFTRTQMQEWMERVLERGLEQFAAQYGFGRGTSSAPSGGGASTDRGDDTRRCRSRSSHEDDHDTRDRRRSRRSSLDVDREHRPQSVPLVSLQLDTYGHTEGDSMRVLGGMVREKKAFGVYPLPKHTAFARAHGIKRAFQFMENGRDIPESEVAGPSNAEVG